MSNINEEVKKALEVLRNGGVILYPTDTIWGLGCDATNNDAVKRIFEIKKRVDSKSMLLLVDVVGVVESYVEELPDIAWDLAEMSDKPLSIIYPKGRNLAKGITAEDGSVGFRVVKEEFCQRLLSRFRKPLVSTSANVSGEKSPVCFDNISEEIKEAVDYVVDWRQNETGRAKPSGIIKLGLGGEVTIIRK